MGASGGLGEAMAHTLSGAGAKLALVGRNQDKLDKLAAAVKAKGGTAETFTADVTVEADVARLTDQVNAKFGKPQILINSAGYTRSVAAADLDGLDDALFDDIVQTNLRGVFATIRAFAPLLKLGGDGLIVNVSSIAGFTGAGSNLAYVAAKAGVDMLTKSLAKALAPQVRVLAVSPGVVDSAFVPGRGADFNDKAAATIPLKRIGQVEDIASAIEACATTLRFATGSRFVVDGGRSL